MAYVAECLISASQVTPPHYTLSAGTSCRAYISIHSIPKEPLSKFKTSNASNLIQFNIMQFFFFISSLSITRPDINMLSIIVLRSFIQPISTQARCSLTLNLTYTQSMRITNSQRPCSRFPFSDSSRHPAVQLALLASRIHPYRATSNRQHNRPHKIPSLSSAVSEWHGKPPRQDSFNCLTNAGGDAAITSRDQHLKLRIIVLAALSALGLGISPNLGAAFHQRRTYIRSSLGDAYNTPTSPLIISRRNWILNALLFYLQ